jgi:hypothetical protein
VTAECVRLGGDESFGGREKVGAKDEDGGIHRTSCRTEWLSGCADMMSRGPVCLV